MKYSTTAFALTALVATVSADSAPVAPTVNGKPFFAGPDFVGSDSTTQPIPTTVNGRPFFAGPDFVGSDSVNYNATTHTGITVTGYTTYCPAATTVTITTCKEHKCAPTHITVAGPTTITVTEECVVPSTAPPKTVAPATTAPPAKSSPTTVAAQSSKPPKDSTLPGRAPQIAVAGGLIAAVAAAVAMV